MKRHTGRAIVVYQDRVLLMERWRDGLHYFSIPGGGIEEGETAEAAATRELFEEMSVVIAPVRVIYQLHAPDAEHIIFLARYIGGEVALDPDSPEAQEQAKGVTQFKPQWVPIADVAALPFAYWLPLKDQLVHDLTQGFSDKAIDIPYPGSVQ